MKQRAAILAAAVSTALAAPLLMTATANADVWQPVPGISIPLPDGVFRGLPGVIATPPPGPVPTEGAPCEGDGHWVHLDGGNAAHYGTEWLCAHN
ncbi:MAG: hypothetical protein JWN03_3647 [Nocardia sp.]|uniref:hypothetical protein n=1 Tax=Nocardia sp. TaxID=1821 RepID=UPI002601F5DE|nr:hypothetical protein [Nocardia sp.]MCU1643372.1 hypothetical protein [Nocardia sp.]